MAVTGDAHLVRRHLSGRLDTPSATQLEGHLIRFGGAVCLKCALSSCNIGSRNVEWPGRAGEGIGHGQYRLIVAGSRTLYNTPGRPSGTWRGVGVVYRAGFENQCTLLGYRGFESRPLRFLFVRVFFIDQILTVKIQIIFRELTVEAAK